MAIGTSVCPTCGKSFQVDSSLVGQSVICPWCGEEIYMEGVDAPQNPNVPLSATPHGNAEPSDPKSDRMTALAPPGLHVLAAGVVLLCAYLGYRSAKGGRRAVPDGYQMPQPTEVSPSSTERFDDAVAIPAAMEDNGGGGGESGVGAAENGPDDWLAVNSPDSQAGKTGNDDPDVLTQSAPTDERGETENMEDESADLSDTVPDVPAVPAGPLTLDATPLFEAYRNAGISAWRCRAALKDFEKAVAGANAEATTNRDSMVGIVVNYLNAHMEKAQAAGDLDKVIAFNNALETAEGGIEGDIEEIVKLRASRDAQRTRIDHVLLAKGATAAKGLHGTLEWQKKEATKKGDFDDAQKIAAFQKQVEEWAKSLQLKAAQAASAKPASSAAAVAQVGVSAPSSHANRPTAASGGSAARSPHWKTVEGRDADAMSDTASSGMFAASASRISNLTLTGTQTEDSVSLPKSPLPHVVKEQYLVPQGKELVVEAGATIVFERDASLYCEGTLKMNGAEKAPIVCKGRSSGKGYWGGITLKTSDSTMSSVMVTGAKTALSIVAGRPTIRDCAFVENLNGVHVEQTNPSFFNCRIADNDGSGVNCTRTGREFLLDHCSLENNGEWGFIGGYYGGASLMACVIRNNKKGGLNSHLWSCDVVAHNCIFEKNKNLDVENGADRSWDFRRNYWGPSVTRLLQQRGDGVNLPNIKDGRDSDRGNIVEISDFLTEPPNDCGATPNW